MGSTFRIGVRSAEDELAAHLQDQAIADALGSLDRLPVVPAVFIDLQRSVADAGSKFSDVAEVIERDPALAAKVLQMANSAIFGCPDRIGGIEQAATRLGLRTLQTLVLTTSIFNSVGSRKLPRSLDMTRLQGLGCLAAGNARALSPDSQDAFIAAMLADVGRLALAVAAPDTFEAISASMRPEDAVHQAEQRYLGVSHGEIGAFLLRQWGLPIPVVEAVAFHHAPEKASREHHALVAVVHVATSVAEDRPIDVDALTRMGFGEQARRWHEQLCGPATPKPPRPRRFSD